MDKNSEDEKIEEYYAMLYKFVYIQLRTEHEVMDIVQETLYKYLVCNIEFPDESAKKAWLIKVARNMCRNYWNSAWYRRVIPFSEKEEYPAGTTPETELLNAEKNQNIMSEVLKLPQKYREIIHMYYYEEMDIETISNITGKKKSTIQTQLERGRKKIKKELEGKI